MHPNPFATRVPLALRITITTAMSSLGFGFGTIGARWLELPWVLALAAGGVCLTIVAEVAWRFPETFFKDRS